jgi:hypothetical protein
MYVCTYVCMFVLMYVCTYVRMYVSMNVCMYVCIYENGCLQPKHGRKLSEMHSCDSSQHERVFTQSVLNSENSWHCWAMLRVVKRDCLHVRLSQAVLFSYERPTTRMSAERLY